MTSLWNSSSNREFSTKCGQAYIYFDALELATGAAISSTDGKSDGWSLLAVYRQTLQAAIMPP
jgi:hypothetical protein